MKFKLGLPSGEKLIGFIKQYKFVFIILVAGLVLLALPSGEKRQEITDPDAVSGWEEDFSVAALEEKLGEILSRVDGAGEVTVMLTVRSGMERILATDRDAVREGSDSSLQEEVIVISTDEGEQVVLVGQNYPVFQGALVVCPGGDDPEVQLMLTRALAALTGLSSSRITVCKGS